MLRMLKFHRKELKKVVSGTEDTSIFRNDS